jgi:hypothetical protein
MPWQVTCETAAVSEYIKDFWLATAAAAPVIALAAVVVVPEGPGVKSKIMRDLHDLEATDTGETDPEAKLLTGAMSLAASAMQILLLTGFNVVVQALLLLASLSSLEAEGDQIPPWSAELLAVGGIFLLAGTLYWGASVRGRLESLRQEGLGTRHDHR